MPSDLHSRYKWLPRENYVDPDIFLQLDPTAKRPTPAPDDIPVEAGPKDTPIVNTPKLQGGGGPPGGGGGPLGGGVITPPINPPVTPGISHRPLPPPEPPLPVPNMHVGFEPRTMTQPVRVIPGSSHRPFPPAGSAGGPPPNQPLPIPTVNSGFQSGGGGGGRNDDGDGGQPIITPPINPSFGGGPPANGGSTGSGGTDVNSRMLLPGDPGYVDPNTVSGGGGGGGGSTKFDYGDEWDENDWDGGEAMAHGGIVMRPTIGRIGESGPEAIMKLGPRMPGRLKPMRPAPLPYSATKMGYTRKGE